VDLCQFKSIKRTDCDRNGILMFRVIGTAEFEKEFKNLRKRSQHGDGEATYLVKIIEKGIEKLKYDYRYGDHITKKKVPQEYIKKHKVENLWKLDLSHYWRLIYTVKGGEIEVISVLLEVLDHKKYDRKFGYKTS
jgi:mRNA-degrading endonuclease YafQ of YafQ-DinJ toxin-antitoxin module